MRILVDMDGVVADIDSYWLELYNRDYKDSLKPEDLVSWDVSDCVTPSCGKKIFDYLKLPDFYLKAGVYPGSQRVVRSLMSKGHEIVFVTASPLWLERAAYEKATWLKIHFPFVPRHNLIITHRKDLVSGDILLDDGVHNIEIFPGIRCIFSRAHNLSYNVEDPHGRVSSWDEFEGFVDKLNPSCRSSSG